MLQLEISGACTFGIPNLSLLYIPNIINVNGLSHFMSHKLN